MSVTLKDTVDRLAADVIDNVAISDRVRELLTAAIREERLLAVEAIRAHAWNWDLMDFANALGESHDDENVQNRFKAFNAANQALRSLDRKTIAVITQR